jgi:hypothetical protein
MEIGYLVGNRDQKRVARAQFDQAEQIDPSVQNGFVEKAPASDQPSLGVRWSQKQMLQGDDRCEPVPFRVYDRIGLDVRDTESGPCLG